MGARHLVLHAPTTGSDPWNTAEVGANGAFRWSRSTPLTWTVNAVNEAGFTITIPWLIEIEAHFIGRSRLLVDGEELPYTIDQHAGMACIKARFDGGTLREIALETPAPIRSAGNPDDQRLLGVAMPMVELHDRPSDRVSKAPIAITDPAKPQICLMGNCQVQTYTWLMERMLGAPARAIVDLSGDAIRKRENQTDFLEKCRGADLILAMHNQYVSFDDIRERTSAPIYTIMNLYFRGTLPDLCYIGSIDDRLIKPLGYQSLIVIDAFHRGVPEEECERQFEAGNFKRLGLLDTWRSSEESIIERAKGIDFGMPRMMTNAAQRYNAFLTFNHPTVLLCYEYLASIFDTLGVPYKTFSFSEMKEPLAVHDMCIVHDEWAEYLQLPYRTTQLYKINNLGGWVSRRELIHHYYAQYATMPIDKLRVNSPLDLVEALRFSPELDYLVERSGN